MQNIETIKVDHFILSVLSFFLILSPLCSKQMMLKNPEFTLLTFIKEKNTNLNIESTLKLPN